MTAHRRLQTQISTSKSHEHKGRYKRQDGLIFSEQTLSSSSVCMTDNPTRILYAHPSLRTHSPIHRLLL